MWFNLTAAQGNSDAPKDLDTAASTASIGTRGGYTIRRSVMQAPGEVCIIRDNGLRSGSC